MDDFLNRLQVGTERFLTWRKRRKKLREEKQKKKNPVLDWVEAFLWAAAVVLIINQYLFQAYQIPSGSMIDTLNIKDRIFVNKVIFGPELVPGMWKLPGFKEPERTEVIIFENPTYLSRGPIFDILQRVIYMVTLSFVDIDKDEEGNPKAHFLIKRAVGVEGDRIKMREGEVYMNPGGTTGWIHEKDFRSFQGNAYNPRRMIDSNMYVHVSRAGKAQAYEQALIPLDPKLKEALDNPAYTYADLYEWNAIRYEHLYKIYPHNQKYGGNWRKTFLGWYIPNGWIFPMGDNRDNSRDARYFGTVSKKEVLGRAMFIYWPLNRAGGIR